MASGPQSSDAALVESAGDRNSSEAQAGPKVTTEIGSIFLTAGSPLYYVPTLLPQGVNFFTHMLSPRNFRSLYFLC